MPKQVTVTHTLYEFEERSDEAKEKAREWYRDADNYFFDAEDFKENNLVEPAAYYHRVKTDECFFGLNHCQGDGVAFYGTFDLDFFLAVPGEEGEPEDGGPLAAERNRLQDMARQLIREGYSVSVQIDGRNGHYHHYNSMDVRVEIDGLESESMHKVSDDLQAGLNEYMTEVSHDIEKRGYEELDYRASDESVDENIRANEYTFTKAGERLEV